MEIKLKMQEINIPVHGHNNLVSWNSTLGSKLIIQRSQNKFSHIITDACKYVTNTQIYNDLATKYTHQQSDQRFRH